MNYGIEDLGLAIGQELTAYWTHDGFSFRGQGLIVSLDFWRVTVRLLVPVGKNGEYQEGDCIVLPRYSDQTCWSAANRVQPGAGTDFRHKDFI